MSLIEPFLNAQFVVSVVVIAVVIHAILIGVAYLIYVERKIASYVQDRIGPNRVGFDFGLPLLSRLKGCLGLGQPLADGIKFMLKEDYCPKGADKALFTLAPAVIIVPALIGFAIMPWGGQWECPSFYIFGLRIEGGVVTIAGAPVNIGVIYVLAVASVGIYGVVLGGWASNNKYSFLGGLRASAQMISYEIPLGLSLLAVLLLTGTLIPNGIIAHQQAQGWLILAQPLAAAIFFICILAEANRAPFDNAECESELVGGYHTEYSSMRFALFFLAEYAHMITSSAFFALLFLGGWSVMPLPFGPDLDPVSAGVLGVLLKVLVYATKVVLLVCLMMLIRWTLPRMRFDQVMHVAWQGMIPLSLVIVVGTAVMIYFGVATPVPMLIANVALAVVTVVVLGVLPQSTKNRRISMLGSRFSPLPDSRVVTAPFDPLARQDHPFGHTASASAR